MKNKNTLTEASITPCIPSIDSIPRNIQNKYVKPTGRTYKYTVAFIYTQIYEVFSTRNKNIIYSVETLKPNLITI